MFWVVSSTSGRVETPVADLELPATTLGRCLSRRSHTRFKQCVRTFVVTLASLWSSLADRRPIRPVTAAARDHREGVFVSDTIGLVADVKRYRFPIFGSSEGIRLFEDRARFPASEDAGGGEREVLCRDPSPAIHSGILRKASRGGLPFHVCKTCCLWRAVNFILLVKHQIYVSNIGTSCIRFLLNFILK